MLAWPKCSVFSPKNRIRFLAPSRSDAPGKTPRLKRNTEDDGEITFFFPIHFNRFFFLCLVGHRRFLLQAPLPIGAPRFLVKNPPIWPLSALKWKTWENSPAGSGLVRAASTPTVHFQPQNPHFLPPQRELKDISEPSILPSGSIR